MAGIPCDLEKIYKYCKKKILIIEDCAHALGTKFKKHVGNFGMLDVFLFIQLNKLQQVKVVC